MMKKTIQKKKRKKTQASTFPKSIAVIHLLPLPGAPRVSIGMSPQEVVWKAGAQAHREAKVLEHAGFDALLIENFGDSPFFSTQVPPETISALSIIAASIRDQVRIPVGVNVLRNDSKAALAIAATSGLDFIRVNILSGVSATDQGWIEASAPDLIRKRQCLQAPVFIFADADVKHAISYHSSSIEDQVRDLVERAGADAILLTGSRTGTRVDLEMIQKIWNLLKGRFPLYVASGITPEILTQYAPFCTGWIVGSYLRKGGRAGELLDLKRVKKFIKAVSVLKKHKKIKAKKNKRK